MWIIHIHNLEFFNYFLYDNDPPTTSNRTEKEALNVERIFPKRTEIKGNPRKTACDSKERNNIYNTKCLMKKVFYIRLLL